ncbi:OmpA family protein [Falsirhodobacter sp. 20TX0035]|uniref:OmpA family protein n=1 Tax=Falsirhodobacter sp. 20TX0035 TaxID=3022019 RepID=UPI00232AE6BC|nr:OmpA family protein [Falsirhodobacter sp. 20TX0035]MDB6454018.1 OmpA family protein [Falsirhodobacter sp. 20TX0035]
MIRWFCLALLAASPASAFTPPVAGTAEVARSADVALNSVTLPLGPWTPEGFPTETVEGHVTRTAWQTTPPDGFTTLSILRPIREALLAEGWTLRLDCETDACGGYDFRYGVEVFPEPQMHVDLGDFRYISAAKGEARLGLMVSRTADLGFVEVVEVAPPGPEAPTRPAPLPETGGDFDRPRVLEGLEFATGGATLDGAQPVLEPLLDWLKANPDRRVQLVGHTDNEGSADTNIALSRARAEAVRDWLVGRGVDAARLSAEGAGFVSPRDTNATAEGRARNRRVEVIPD